MALKTLLRPVLTLVFTLVGTRAVAQAYVEYLYTEEGQKIAAWAIAKFEFVGKSILITLEVLTHAKSETSYLLTQS